MNQSINNCDFQSCEPGADGCTNYKVLDDPRRNRQSYEIKSSPWTILWFRILGIFSVENIEVVCFYVSNLRQ